MASSTRKSSVVVVSSFDEYKALTQAQQAKLAKAIHDDRDSGLSGNDLREKYGEWLTGPRRRRVLRDHGFGGVIAPSYEEYTDDKIIAQVTGGKSRTGTKWSGFHGHGRRAAERREGLTKAQQADQAKLAQIAKRQTRKRSVRNAK